MRVVVVYKDSSDYGRETREWIQELKRREGEIEVEELDPETREGEGFCVAHGIVDYPAVIVSGEGGKVYFSSMGRQLPMFDEVINYALAG